MVKKCNCGHLQSSHNPSNTPNNIKYNQCKLCKCKKYQYENQMPKVR